jgi:hypothetical protein
VLIFISLVDLKEVPMRVVRLDKSTSCWRYISVSPDVDRGV